MKKTATVLLVLAAGVAAGCGNGTTEGVKHTGRYADPKAVAADMQAKVRAKAPAGIDIVVTCGELTKNTDECIQNTTNEETKESKEEKAIVTVSDSGGNYEIGEVKH